MNVEVILKEKGGDIISISPTASISDAAALLSGRKIGALVVTDGTSLSGILSERDIVRAIVTDGAAALGEPVSHFMTENVVTCSRVDTTLRLMDLMTGGRFRHLPVVEDGQVIGLISIGDVVKARISETEMEAEQLKMYIASG
ncbi:MAG: CBS domain-containing protein [Rhodobiaceae bacterium]|nr:CBS domain-containing protein [Rhodobiaceae bacterium]